MTSTADAVLARTSVACARVAALTSYARQPNRRTTTTVTMSARTDGTVEVALTPTSLAVRQLLARPLASVRVAPAWCQPVTLHGAARRPPPGAAVRSAAGLDPGGRRRHRRPHRDTSAGGPGGHHHRHRGSPVLPVPAGQAQDSVVAPPRHGPARLRTERLQLSSEETTVVPDLDLRVRQGKITALVGRNGCGKFTILRALARLLKPTAGHVYLDGKAVHTLATKEVARQLAILPQAPTAPEALTVEELASLGRYPHQSLLGRPGPEDTRMVERALHVTGMLELRERSLTTLSGGQRQRAWIAMALAQGTDLLLLDEPTTYLDMAHQLEVLELLQDLNQTQGKTIVMVVHDLNHAARYADHVVAVLDGAIAAEGPREILTAQLLREVFGVEARVYLDEETGAPICVPYRTRRTTASEGAHGDGRLRPMSGDTPAHRQEPDSTPRS